MAVLRTTLCVVLMVAVALSKPVSLTEGEDSSKESESNEINSSEEAAAQPASTETEVANALEETDPAGTAAPLPSAEPSLATLNTSALPEPEDPQTSADALLTPDDPSQTPLGVDVSQDMPNTDPVQDSFNGNTEHVLPDAEVSPHPAITGTDLIIGIDGSNQPQVTTTTTTTYQGFPKGAAPPFPPSFSKAPAMPVPVGTDLTSAPVCFTFQFTTPEPLPPRGDSI